MSLWTANPLGYPSRMDMRTCGFLAGLAIACSLAAACGNGVAVEPTGTGGDAGSTTSSAGGASTTTVTTSSSSAGGGGSGPTMAEACATYWEASCTEYEACFPASSLIYFGDHATCTARMTAGCLSSFSAAGSATLPSDILACGAALTNLTCQSYNRFLARETDLGGCGLPSGTLAIGAACGSAAQCASLVCDVSANQACGQCASGEAGAPCKGTKGCQIGLRCAQGTCVAPGQFGASCTASTPCSAIFTCFAGACEHRLTLGSTCNPFANDSPCETGLVCNPVSKACETFDVGPLGAACGLVADNTLDYCTHATFCDLDSPNQGTCVEALSDGEACMVQTNGFEPCTYPARCIQGLCTYPDATACQ